MIGLPLVDLGDIYFRTTSPAPFPIFHYFFPLFVDFVSSSVIRYYFKRPPSSPHFSKISLLSTLSLSPRLYSPPYFHFGINFFFPLFPSSFLSLPSLCVFLFLCVSHRGPTTVVGPWSHWYLLLTF